MQQPTRVPEPQDSGIAAAWPRRRQDLAIVIWVSFLTAATASVLCFAFVDPAKLDLLPDADPALMRMSGYALGFFFLWITTATSGALVLYLVRTAHDGASRAVQAWTRDGP